MQLLLKIKLFCAKHILWLIFFAAILVRIFFLVTHGTIVNDGIVYIGWAKIMAEGNWLGGTALHIFNLYPLLIVLSYKFFNIFFTISYENAALLLNTIFGLSIIYPLYKLTWKYFGPMPAILTGFYLTLQPEFVRMSSDVLRGPAYLSGTIWAFYFFITALRYPSPKAWSIWRLVFSGLLIIISALVRLEALVWMGCFGITILLARIGKNREYLFASRIKAIIALGSMIIILALPAATLVRIKTGQWHLARLDKITEPWSMGTIKTKSKNPLKDLINKLQSEMYSEDGTENPDIGTCVRFMKMAKTHRWIIYGSEILAALWKAFHGVAAIAFVFGVWFVIRRKLLPVDDPLAVVTIVSTVIFGGMFLLYVEGGKYYLATRHIMTMALVYSLFIGVSSLAAVGKSKHIKLLAFGIIVLAFGILIFKDKKPIRRHKLPMKYCGIQLAKQLPEKSFLLLPSSLRPVAYYADLPYKPLSSIEVEWVKKFLNKKPNRYLLINKTKNWQVDLLYKITGAVEKVEFNSPSSKKYSFELYKGNNN